MSSPKRKKRSGGKKRKTNTGQPPRPVSRDLPELQQARALWIQNRFPEALRLFDKAVRKNPNNPMALTDAARAFGTRFEFGRAERLIARLVEISGGRAELLQMAGQSYRMIQRPDRAIDCLEKALQSSADLFESRLELALLYERRHQLDLAHAHVAECTDRNPNSCEAQFLRGRVLRRLGQISDAEPILRQVAQSSQNHSIVRAQAWHDLGQLLDETGQYDEAFKAVIAGKQIQRNDARDTLRKSQVESNRLEKLLSELTAEHFRAWRKEAADFPTERVAMLTGPPRSGTTLLERVLDAHPQVISSDEQIVLPTYILPSLFLHKGPDDLLTAADLDDIGLPRIRDERQRYLRYMEGALGESINSRMHIDKNPSIVMLIPGMLRLFPECKLLIAIRDPRDVLVSCFLRYLPLNTVSVQFITPEGVAKRNKRDMEAWLSLREMIESPWLEIKYEDAVENLEREARRSLDFLGVAWDSTVLSYRDRLNQRQVNSPTYEAVAKPIYRSAMGRWRNYEKHLRSALEQIAPLVEKFGYDL